MRMVVVMVWLAAACGGESAAVDAGFDSAIDADEGTGFRVELNVIGVRDPMTIKLQDGDGDQAILVTEDGNKTFRFPRRLPDGRDFAITLDGTQACMSTELTGTIAGADATVAITCDGVVDLQKIASQQPLTPLRFTPRFDPYITTYDEVFAPLLVDPGATTQLVASSRYVQNVAITPPEVMWPTLATTVTDVTASVDHAPFGTRTTTMKLSRKLLQEAFGKAVLPLAADHLGGIDIPAQRGVGGEAIAISGETLVVGAPGTFPSGGVGAAYVFVRSGVNWHLEAQLNAPVTGANFGTSVAIDGDTVVVGAPTDGANGAAYVFHRDGLAWSLVATLRPTADLSAGAQEGAMFGGSVAISGSFLVVGAWGNGNASGNGLGDGAAFIFKDNGVNGWGLAQAAIVPAAGSDEALGGAVAMDATRLAIGAPGNAGNGVYMFSLSGNTWTPDGKIVNPAAVGSHFGAAVAVSGDLVVVGAPFEDDVSGGFDQGRAYVYHREGGVWVRKTSLPAPAQFAAFFGFSVAIHGHHVIVGAPFEDVVQGTTKISAGKVHYFRCTLAGICPAAEEKTFAASSANQNHFGTSVAIDRFTFVVGAPNEDTDAADSGAFYVFR